MSTRPPAFILAWFAADTILTLAPPLHWWASGSDPLLGAPRVLVYMFGLCLFVAASVIAAYLCDPAHARAGQAGR